MLAHRLRRWPSIKTSTGSTLRVCWELCSAGLVLLNTAGSTGSTLRVCWELRSAGLVLLNTAGDDYKPAPIQCLLNVGPAYLQVPACLFFTFVFFSDYIYIYIHSTYNIQYRTKENKTIRRGPCKVKTIPELTTPTHPPIQFSFFFGNQSTTWEENLVHVVAGDE